MKNDDDKDDNNISIPYICWFDFFLSSHKGYIWMNILHVI